MWLGPSFFIGFSMDYAWEDRCDRVKKAWAVRHKWRPPPAEVSVSLFGQIDAQAADRVIAVAEDDPGAPLFLAIDSNGGNPLESLRIYNFAPREAGTGSLPRWGPVQFCGDPRLSWWRRPHCRKVSKLHSSRGRLDHTPRWGNNSSCPTRIGR